MSGINMPKVVVGGLVAGVVINAVNFVVNGVMLGPEWQTATVARGVDPAAIERPMLAGWITSGFLMGLAIVWIYAAIRPRFGPGPSTAACAGMVAWVISYVAYFSLAFTGMYPTGVIVMSTIGGLVGYLAGAYIGGRLYTESPSGRRVAV